MSKPLALVTGATGAIGPTLVSHLLKSGYKVRTLNRTAPEPGLFVPNVDFVAGSITDPNAVTRSLKNVDIAFHLAALLHIENPKPEMAAQYYQTNVEGSRLIAHLAQRNDVKRFVYFSTVKVYGIQQRQPVPETQDPDPTTIYARTKLEGEKAIQAIDDLETVTIRLSAVYGPRLRGSWARLVRAIQQNRFLPVGDLQNVHSITHVDDVARAALLVAEHPEAVGKTFNLVGHETPTLHDILSAIYTSHGRRLPPVRIPPSFMLIGGHILEKGSALLGNRTPVPVSALRQLVTDEAYSGVALRGLGFVPQVDLVEGWLTSRHSR